MCTGQSWGLGAGAFLAGKQFNWKAVNFGGMVKVMRANDVRR
jgi:hypothetical protein